MDYRVVKARENDEDKLKLLRDFEPLIKKCIKIYLKDRYLYEDALHEGYAAILCCIKRFDINSEYPFNAYVKRAVIYAVRDFSWRGKYTASLDEISNEGVSLYDVLESPDRVEDEALLKDEYSQLQNALEELPEKQRKVVEDFYFKGVSMKEVCKNRRCHYMSVVKLKDRAVKNIRRIMTVSEGCSI